MMIHDILWTHPPDRFIPSSLDPDCPECVILIGHQEVPDRSFVINASQMMINTPHIEWVHEHKEAARVRYKHWKSLKYPLETIRVSS